MDALERLEREADRALWLADPELAAEFGVVDLLPPVRDLKPEAGSFRRLLRWLRAELARPTGGYSVRPRQPTRKPSGPPPQPPPRPYLTRSCQERPVFHVKQAQGAGVVRPGRETLG